MTKKKSNLFDKYKIVLVALVAVVVLISIYSLSDGTDEVNSNTDEVIVSKLPGVVAEDIDCIYLGDKPNFGHFGQYSGRVSNEGDETAVDVKVIIEFYDANGRSVGTHDTSIVGQNLTVGGTKAFFSYTNKGTLSGEFTSCKARIE